MRTREEIIHAFTPAGNLKSEQQIRVMKVSNAFKDMALEIESLVPDCPDKTAALRKLLESKFTCVQAITHAKVAEEPVKQEKK